MWERLDLKMTQSTQANKIRSYKFLTRIAATISILCIAGYYIQNSKEYNPNLIAYAPSTGLVMEDLPDGLNDFYNVEKLESLSDAYKKLESNKIK